LIDNGVDTGEILFQKYVSFDNNENTFIKTYSKLISSIEELFIEHFEEIISKKFKSYPQIGCGTYHSKKELPTEFLGWNVDINSEISRIKKILNRG
jgi:methionyl-tRNA formyltransferase